MVRRNTRALATTARLRQRRAMTPSNAREKWRALAESAPYPPVARGGLAGLPLAGGLVVDGPEPVPLAQHVGGLERRHVRARPGEAGGGG